MDIVEIDSVFFCFPFFLVSLNLVLLWVLLNRFCFLLFFRFVLSISEFVVVMVIVE